MKAQFIVIFLFCSLCISCNNQSERAAEYSDEIMVHQIAIIDAMDSLKASFRRYETEEMNYAHVDLQKSIGDGVRKLNSIEPFGNDTIYLDQARSLFKAYENLSKNEIPQIIEILNIPDSSFTSENQSKVFKLQKTINSTLEDSHDEFLQAQLDFGKKYKVKFQEEVE